LLASVIWLRRQAGTAEGMKITSMLLALFAGQLILGVLNILLLAPVWLQMVHLVMSDLIWASLVLTAGTWFADGTAFERFTDQRVKVGIENRPA